MNSAELSRREFVQRCALGAMALASASILRGRDAAPRGGAATSGGATRTMKLNGGWKFGGKFTPGSQAADFADGNFAAISLPHAVAPQSWQNWDPTKWQDVWIYRRHFTVPSDFKGKRVFLHFDGVMVGATPTVNGHELPPHYGGYLPFRYEITEWLRDGDNVLALAVDSRWSQVPPEGSPRGAAQVDYLEMGGIHRSVRLEAVPQVYVADVFAKPVNVLDANRHVDVTCTLDAATAPNQPASVSVELRDGQRVIAQAKQDVRIDKTGRAEVALTLANVGDVKLWSPESPTLYHVVTTLSVNGQPLHDHAVRIGFREAKFTVDGFFLNGQRYTLFGLNRHEIYPYVGFSMPDRVIRRDAQILRHDFNCNVVRCSHYPQNPAFLDACDELGLMVWEEVPGWQYIGDAPWQELLIRDTRDMIIRDRNRPSIIIWGTRVNESPHAVELYKKTRALAKELDDSRQSSGTITPDTRKNWQTEWAEDVFAYDDYHSDPDGTVGILDPLPGVPYFLAETVGQFNYTKKRGFDSKYRRAGEIALQTAQAIRHAQAHSKAAQHPRMGGVIAWCAYDYSSLVNPYNVLKCPGVADGFRIPKLGAAFYLTQGDAKKKPVIVPNFYWDFGPQSPRGPGKQVAIFSNCDRLVLLVDDIEHATLKPDTARYPHLKHAPFFADLDFDDANHSDLRIEGYVGDEMVASRSMSSDRSLDKFMVAIDDHELIGDGSDATRLTFKVADKFGNERAFGTGEVTFEIKGGATIVGDNPFDLAPSGGVGGVWIRTQEGATGTIVVTARHATRGPEAVTIRVRPAA